MLFNGHDWREFVASLKWFFGKGPKPQFDRWTYWEKFDYFAVFWGIAIIGSTGLMLWFKVEATEYVPRWIVYVAERVHFYEAILACLAIVVWHFYGVIFDPDVYPLNWAFWDGKISNHLYEEEHPLDMIRALKESGAAAPAGLEVRFEPQGVSNGGDFHLTARGLRFRVTVDPLTGRVRSTRE